MNAILQPAALADDAAWSQVLRRDPAADFVYAVTTTGVFCRPSCSSRRPLRRNTRFFRSPAQAAAAGFRPCQRCRPADPLPARGSNPIDLVRRHIEANLDRAVTLAELGRIANLSPFTVQRQFKQQMGVSPLQYRRALRARRFRSALARATGHCAPSTTPASGPPAAPMRLHRWA